MTPELEDGLRRTVCLGLSDALAEAAGPLIVGHSTISYQVMVCDPERKMVLGIIDVGTEWVTATAPHAALLRLQLQLCDPGLLPRLERWTAALGRLR